MNGCFYRRRPADGDYQVFDSTDFTRSNWAADLQHGSPPLALLTRAIEELLPTSLRIGRLSLEILGAVPVARVKVRAWVERPGKRICLLAADMRAHDGAGTERPVARVSAWALATSDTGDVARDRHPPLTEGPAQPLPPHWWNATGYLEAVRWRPQPDDPAGAAVSWLSPLTHLVDTDDTTPLQRLAMVVDSANGIGAALDPARFTFMNTDSVVHLHRLPVGVDFGVRARGSIGPDGIGVTTAELFDRTGFIGTSAQTLLIQRRG
ncbi:thioesterase [Mycobacterium talmoniae]|uniref:Thioesterase n=1 Tax=Mycobacterium talmoniae TaxID=1858794 RepID=A0A1S1NJX0_9MYCO|nr:MULTISPECIES: thioesterase family protein [Mycobacterium]OHV04161.1 thioesterase [Mycobacterium talmoniae]TDH56969.1 thioesterase family protein [Mycobacterium eburneum]